MQKRILITGIVLMAVLLAFTATLVVAAPAPFLSRLTFLQPPRTGTDPLSQTEILQAQQTANQDAGLSAQLNAAQRTEVLLVERHQETKSVRKQGNWPRRADMYVYNYDTNTLTYSIINLDTGAVDVVETAQNVQLPPNQAETERAIQLALADPQVNAILQTQYQATSGTPLTNPQNQLDIHVLTFKAQSGPDQPQGAVANCGLHRCAQLLITTQNGYFINLLPVVDLSNNQVINVTLNSGP